MLLITTFLISNTIRFLCSFWLVELFGLLAARLGQWEHLWCLACAYALRIRQLCVFFWLVCWHINLVWPYQQPQRFLAARPRSLLQLALRAQKLSCLAPFFCGAFRLLPVARLYLARPFSVRPAPALTLSFSPRPTLRLTFLFGINNSIYRVFSVKYIGKVVACSRDHTAILLCISWQYSASTSVPILAKPSCCAAHMVVPAPANGSYILLELSAHVFT